MDQKWQTLSDFPFERSRQLITRARQASSSADFVSVEHDCRASLELKGDPTFEAAFLWTLSVLKRQRHSKAIPLYCML